MLSGELKAWEILETLVPSDVCRRSGARYDPEVNGYTIRCFGRDFLLSMKEERLRGDEFFLAKLGHFFSLSVLFYLNTAVDVPPTGRLIRPDDLKGGLLFIKGSHVLPLEALASKYGSNAEGFLKKGLDLGAETARYGDAALRLLPLPRIPIYLILWKADEEFPARADLLFDSSSEIQAPVDILWSVATMTVQAMIM